MTPQTNNTIYTIFFPIFVCGTSIHSFPTIMQLSFYFVDGKISERQLLLSCSVSPAGPAGLWPLSLVHSHFPLAKKVERIFF